MQRIDKQVVAASETRQIEWQFDCRNVQDDIAKRGLPSKTVDVEDVEYYPIDTIEDVRKIDLQRVKKWTLIGFCGGIDLLIKAVGYILIYGGKGAWLIIQIIWAIVLIIKTQLESNPYDQNDSIPKRPRASEKHLTKGSGNTYIFNNCEFHNTKFE